MFLKCQNRKFIIVFHVNFCFLILSFWGFSIMLFLICFFCHFITPIGVDYQCVTSNQQDFKNYVTPQDWPAQGVATSKPSRRVTA